MQFFLERTLLFERIAGIILYLSVLAIVCNGITVSQSRSVRGWLLLYAFVLGVMGFIYLPAESADLVRLEALMSDWASHDFDWLVEQLRSTSTPVYVLYFWLIGQLDCKALLPAVTAFLHYLLVFSCLWDYAKRNACSQRSVALTLFIYMVMGSFLSTISGIRSYLAFAMISRAVYLEWSNNRLPIRTSLYYLLAIGMHPAAVLLAILRFALLPFEHRSGRYARYSSVICTLIIIVALGLIASPMVVGVFAAAESYGLDNNSYFNLWETLIHLLAVLFVLYTARKALLVKCRHDYFIDNARRFAMLVALFSIAFLPFEYAVFSRFSTFAFVISMPMMLKILSSRDESYRLVLIITSILILSISCTRGDLTAYKFFII